MASRRVFLMAGGLTLFWGSGGVPGFMARAASQSKNLFPYKKNNVLVCIFQRCVMDGLMAVTPFTDPFLKDLCSSLYSKKSTFRDSMMVSKVVVVIIGSLEFQRR
jgi:uncharacterized protein (DUF1501 family)